MRLRNLDEALFTATIGPWQTAMGTSLCAAPRG